MNADLKSEADSSASPSKIGELIPVGRGAYHRILEWLSLSTDESGSSAISTHYYTEVASGLHYLNASATQPALTSYVAVAPGAGAYVGLRQDSAAFVWGNPIVRR